jgi:O-antigen/teichoic acid export membrane protein
VSSIKKNLFYNVLLSLSQILFPLITFPYISRVLNPTGFGIVSFADSFTQYFILLAALGVPVYGVREVAKIRHDKTKLSKLFSELLIINIISTLCCLLLYLVLILTLDRLNENQSIFFIGCGILVSNVFLVEWFFLGLEDFQYIVKRTIVFRLLITIFIFLTVNSPEDKIWYYGITFLFYPLSGIANMVYAQRFINVSYRGLHFKKHIKPLIFIFSTTIVISMYAILDNIILGFLTNETYVGYYAVSLRISKFSLAIVGALGLVLIPRLSAIFQKENRSEALSLLNKSVQYVIIFSVPISLGILMMSPELIMVFSGESYTPAITSLRVLSFIVVIIGFAQIFSQQILIPMDKERYIFKSVLAGVVVSLSLNFLLIPIYRHNGAAISNVVTELIVTIMLYNYTRKFLRLSFTLRGLFFSIFSCSMFFPIKLFVELFFPIKLLADGFELYYLFKLSLVIVLSAGSYLMFQTLIFKNVLINEYLNVVYLKVYSSLKKDKL